MSQDSPPPPNGRCSSHKWFVFSSLKHKKIQWACFTELSQLLITEPCRIKQPGHNSWLSPASRNGYKPPDVPTVEKLPGRSYIIAVKGTRICSNTGAAIAQTTVAGPI